MMTTTKTVALETLTPEQAAWCRANGIAFRASRGYCAFSNAKTGFYVEIYRSAVDFDVCRQPTTEEEGPDCNDGEPVRLATFGTLREALRELATRPATARRAR